MTLIHHPTKNGTYNSCGSGDQTFLICHVTLSDHVIKKHVTLVNVYSCYRKGVASLTCHVTRDIWLGKWEPLDLSHHCARFDAYRSCSSGDITFLFCRVTSHDYTIIGTYVAWWVGSLQPKPQQCQFWHLQVLWKWR